MKKILSVAFDIPGYSHCYTPYNSTQSLLDADVIVFQPDFSYYNSWESYHGKVLFDENDSFKLVEDTRHWHSEISTALQDGKTVFVFMAKYENVAIHTGDKTYSGTGRNTRITNIVKDYNNYYFLPVKIPNIISKEGEEVKFNHNSIFTALWNEFQEYMIYESYIDGKIECPLFFTKTGNKPLGGVFKVGKGSLILLPMIYFPDEFTQYEKKQACWTEQALKVGERLVQIFITIDDALRESVETSPPPEWVKKRKYKLASEEGIKEDIDNVSEKVESLISAKNSLVDSLEKEVRLKNLLYEKGKPLENAIIDAMQILGFNAESYNDGFLEIDQILISPEGDRYIGETEGKDKKAINIDKFRQLESNIQEDLQKENVKEPAIGILFGNGFRLTPPDKREEQFTKKCIANAARSNTVLIKTPDLFEIAKYVKERKDRSFAKKCRKVILNSRGKIVEFPKIKK